MSDNKVSDNNSFKMTYSAAERTEIEQIRSKYEDKKEDGIARLRAIDAQSESKAKMVSIVLGVVGTLIFGTGLSLCLSEFGSFLGSLSMPVGILVGLIGLVMMALATPMFNYTLKKEREKRKDEVLALADELMKQS